MTTPAAQPVLNRHFLEVRARILEIAACLDRIERADCDDSIGQTDQMRLLRAGIEILSSEGFDRAERIQMLFSDPYVPDWRS